MVSFNHDVSSLTRKDPALKYNLRNRPSSRSAGPAPRAQHPSRQAGTVAKGRGVGTTVERDKPCLGDSPWGLPAPGFFARTAPEQRGRATAEQPRSPADPRRDPAAAPPSPAPQLLPFGAHQQFGVPLALASLPKGAGPACGSLRVVVAGPRGCSEPGRGCAGRGGTHRGCG